MKPILTFFVVALIIGANLPLEARQGPGSKMRTAHGAAPPEPIRFSRSEVLEVKRNYRDVLRKFASGEREAALEGLTALEGRYVNPRQMQGAGKLGKVQSEVIQQLSRKDPELMLPILQLHLDATRVYTDRREWFLAQHSRRLAGAVAESYANDGGSQGARVMAGRAFIALGATLQEGMASEDCRCVPFYERALDFDPEDAAALLGLATVYEKAANYEQAVTELQRLVKAHPNNAEARLRLAINLKRTGRGDDALEHLDHLLGDSIGPVPEWILSLAYQEKIRGAIENQDWAAAEATLTGARTRLPDHQRLIVLQAFVLEQTRRPVQARRVLQDLRGQPKGAGDTPRLLYTRMPQDLIDQTAQALREGAENRLPLLRAELDKGEGGTR